MTIRQNNSRQNSTQKIKDTKMKNKKYHILGTVS